MGSVGAMDLSDQFQVQERNKMPQNVQKSFDELKKIRGLYTEYEKYFNAIENNQITCYKDDIDCLFEQTISRIEGDNVQMQHLTTVKKYCEKVYEQEKAPLQFLNNLENTFHQNYLEMKDLISRSTQNLDNNPTQIILQTLEEQYQKIQNYINNNPYPEITDITYPNKQKLPPPQKKYDTDTQNKNPSKYLIPQEENKLLQSSQEEENFSNAYDVGKMAQKALEDVKKKISLFDELTEFGGVGSKQFLATAWEVTNNGQYKTFEKITPSFISEVLKYLSSKYSNQKEFTIGERLYFSSFMEYKNNIYCIPDLESEIQEIRNLIKNAKTRYVILPLRHPSPSGVSELQGAIQFTSLGSTHYYVFVYDTHEKRITIVNSAQHIPEGDYKKTFETFGKAIDPQASIEFGEANAQNEEHECGPAALAVIEEMIQKGKILQHPDNFQNVKNYHFCQILMYDALNAMLQKNKATPEMKQQVLQNATIVDENRRHYPNVQKPFSQNVDNPQYTQQPIKISPLYQLQSDTNEQPQIMQQFPQDPKKLFDQITQNESNQTQLDQINKNLYQEHPLNQFIFESEDLVDQKISQAAKHAKEKPHSYTFKRLIDAILNGISENNATGNVKNTVKYVKNTFPQYFLDNQKQEINQEHNQYFTQKYVPQSYKEYHDQQQIIQPYINKNITEIQQKKLQNPEYNQFQSKYQTNLNQKYSIQSYKSSQTSQLQQDQLYTNQYMKTPKENTQQVKKKLDTQTVNSYEEWKKKYNDQKKQ